MKVPIKGERPIQRNSGLVVVVMVCKKKMFESSNPGRSMSDQAQYLINPREWTDMHVRIDTETVRALEALHVIETQHGKRRRYGSRTLSSLVNRLLPDEVKRHRQTQR